MAEGEQLLLALPFRAADGRDDFLVAPCNAAAVAWVDQWPDWPAPARGLVIYGPAAAGKSHLAAVWRSATGGIALDAMTLTVEGLRDRLGAARYVTVDNLAATADSEAVFHLFNLVVERGGALVFLARAAPSRMAFPLADLASRLASLPTVAIASPDDALLAGVLAKLCRDRQLAVGEEVIAYLTARMERSFAAAHDVVARLDQAAVSGQRRVTLWLARQVLSQGEEAT
ncbi:MAG: HdaA/DnaA family protein [Thalassobaculaceae bacterium]